MDAAAHPAGKAFPVKPVAPPALEPGAKWKALPYKLRKKISNAAALVVIAFYIPPLMAWGCWANSQVAFHRRLPAEAKFIFADILELSVAFGLFVLGLAGYSYLRYISSNKRVFWDGVRGYYHKWRTHRNNACTAILEMVADPALRPEKDVRTVASIGRDALVFGVLAGAFACAAVGIFVGNQFGLFDGLDMPDLPYAPGEVFQFTTLMAALVLGLFSLGKGWEFYSAWRRFVFASAKRGILGWWREFSASDDWKRFVSLRPTFSAWRCALFSVLLGLLVYLTHATIYHINCTYLGIQHEIYANESAFAVCPMGPFKDFMITEFGAGQRGYRISAKTEAPTLEYLADQNRGNWYSIEPMVVLEEERRRKAELLGWTGERMASEIELQRSELEALCKKPTLTADEFEVMLEPLQMEGFKWKRDDYGFVVDSAAGYTRFDFSLGKEMRADFDGGRLLYLETGALWERIVRYDFSHDRVLWAYMESWPKRELPPLQIWRYLPFWLAVFAFGWSLLLAPLLFLRFTYDPDREREMQAAAAPATAPFSPPST